MKIKKLIATLLAGAALITCVSCGEKTVNLDEKVTLKYIMSGPGMQEDSNKVWEEFNKKLHEKLPNVTVEFEVFPYADYKQKFMLMQASGEKIDIANTYQLDYADEVRSGSFVPMDDLLDKYGQDIKKALPEWLFEYGTVDGVLYQIPSYQMLALPEAIITQADFADKYLDKEALEKAVANSVIFPEEGYDILEDYLEKLKASGNIQYGFDTGTAPVLRGYEMIESHYAIREDDEKCEIVYVYETPEYKNAIKRFDEWYKKGYIREDSITAVDAASVRGKMDGYVVWKTSTNPEAIERQKAAGKDFYEIWLEDAENIYINYKNDAGGTAIMSSSKHPEQAMQLLNLLQTDKELYNLLTFGIEGVHYTKISENEIETVSGKTPSSSDAYGLNGWIIGNTELQYCWQNYTPEYHDWCFNVINKSKNHSRLRGFVPDLSKIETKISQVVALRSEYKDSLISGSLPDWEKTYNEWMEKIDIAGNKEIKAELQRQIDEFLKNKEK